MFQRHPEIMAKLWGGNLWTSGYYAHTVGQYANEEVIKSYVENQGKEEFTQEFTMVKLRSSDTSGLCPGVVHFIKTAKVSDKIMAQFDG